MLQFPEIDPVALAIGPLKIRWYGLMYLFGFAAAWLLGNWRAKSRPSVLKPDQVGDMVFYGAVGLVVGARVGYIIFYELGKWMQDDPLLIFKVWEGGMSFHGGLIGTALGLFLYARKVGRHWLDMVDFVAPFAPIGIFCGRIGNFIGGELYGRATDVPWAMVFPDDDKGLPRHPSQLYEAFLEGICLFIILFWYSRKPRPRGAVIGMFVMLYGVFRFSVEFFREPDAHIQFDLFGWVTRGQILSTPMILVGAALIYLAYRNGKTPEFSTSGAAPKTTKRESPAAAQSSSADATAAAPTTTAPVGSSKRKNKSVKKKRKRR